jgi:hypothetical protein
VKHAFDYRLSAFFAAGVVALAGCSPDATTAVASPSSNVLASASAGTHLQYGTPVKLGNGNARTYVVTNARAGQAPVELGIALSERALDGLPSSGASSMYLLPLPQQAPAPYELVELDWNPQGHPPEGVYTVPHFDFHFYTITRAERDAIMPADPHYAMEASNVPTDGFVPPAYAPLAGPGQSLADVAVPMMGLHWEDLLSPELQALIGHPENYRPFDKTFIYGSWNGQFIFYEPMVTRGFLQTKPDISSPVRTPQLYSKAGYFPTSYRVTYDTQAKEYHIALTGLVKHD